MRLLISGLALIALTAAAMAAPPAPLPPEVLRYIGGFDQICRQAGGIPGNHGELVQVVDLTGDGVSDYVVDIHSYNCLDAAAAVSAGRDGMAVAIFVGGSGGSATKVYEAITDGATLDRGGARPRLYVDVGGVDCGQQNASTLPYTDWTFCSRPLDWNAKKKTFEFAPLSQARPIE